MSALLLSCKCLFLNASDISTGVLFAIRHEESRASASESKGLCLLQEAFGGRVEVRVRVAKAVDECSQEARREHQRHVLRPARLRCSSRLPSHTSHSDHVNLPELLHLLDAEPHFSWNEPHSCTS